MIFLLVQLLTKYALGLGGAAFFAGKSISNKDQKASILGMFTPLVLIVPFFLSPSHNVWAVLASHMC